MKNRPSTSHMNSISSQNLNHINITQTVAVPIRKRSTRIEWLVVYLLICVTAFTVSVNVFFMFDQHLDNLDAPTHLHAVVNSIGNSDIPKDEHVDSVALTTIATLTESLVGSSDSPKSKTKVKRSINIEAYSSKDLVFVSVDGIKVLDIGYGDSRILTGIHIAVLNQATGHTMSTRQFDVYSSKAESDRMVHFLNGIKDGRILCFAVKDEATSCLKKTARNLLRSYGSGYIERLAYRDSWAMILSKRGEKYAEVHKHIDDLNKWPDPVVAQAKVELSESDSVSQCSWANTDESRRRKAFCDKYEGYGSVCQCLNPDSFDIRSLPLPENRVTNDIPVAVIASNRGHYLYRALRSMLSAHGAKRELFTVFIDGFFEEPVDVVKLFGIKVVQHAPISKNSGRIAQHYKRALTETFNMFPDAQYMIILEEDLDVAVDIFSYFSQLLPLMDQDESLYCVSTWNDQCYDHSCHDPAMLYRVETMPGLGWMLKRRLYKKELEPRWPTPDLLWDWDMWMRLEENIKGRECIIPDVSRTYHFGARGLNVNVYFQDSYFTRRKLNTVADVKLNVGKMKKDNYEAEIDRLVSTATVLNHTKNPCKNEKDFIPDTRGKVYVFYIEMKHASDWTTWNNIARCLHIWDLDVRGFHKSMWRMWLKTNHVLIVGSPASPYAKHKPGDVKPIFLKSKKT